MYQESSEGSYEGPHKGVRGRLYTVMRGLNEATVRGETPLHLAARANQTDIIRILLRNGAKVDARARVSKY